ncbi:MAG: DUF2141 domain-containing protein [Gammaproteobacteria bacterium]|jgi:uncharacterized protein (DUF2141 family)|nr:DUF2141 domain-containing protein [Gammaproteobacteria bacterium]
MKMTLRRILHPLLLLLVAYTSSAAVADGSLLRVELSGLQEVEGNIYIAVYDSDDTWLGDDTVYEQQVVIADARDGELVWAEMHLPPGEYALSIFYDSNNNGELDTNFIGIPKEPVALSNNARPKFGPPKYKDAVFTLGEEPLTQSISMEEI